MAQAVAATPLLGANEDSPLADAARGRTRALRVGAAAVFAAALAASGVMGVRRQQSLSGLAALAKLATVPLGMEVSDEYSRKLRMPIGEALYPYDYLVQIHKETVLAVSNADDASSMIQAMGSDYDFTYAWELYSTGVSSAEGDHVEVTFDTLGYHTVRVTRSVSAPEGTDMAATALPLLNSILTTQVMVKYVRRELRSMTDDDRNGFFEALKLIYTVGQTDGTATYGSKYRSIEYLVAEHLQGAASKECDHWHDDAGILTHHMAFTLELEQSLQSVDNTIAMPYWDYTADAEFLGTEHFHLSPVFSEDWFGALSPANDDHVIDSGRWAFTSIATVDDSLGLPTEYTKIKNPYGLLRAPWNSNPTPYITRFDKVLGINFGGFPLPTCSEFIDAYRHEKLGFMFSELNGLLHGPIHIIIGGQWFWDERKLNITTLVKDADLRPAASFFLLSSKFLWRQGFVRCPEFCSMDTSPEDCSCSCPTEITGNRSAADLLDYTGLSFLDNGWLRDVFLKESGMSYESMWDLMCHIGKVGEMFTSAAPYDPTFWPLHGLAERFLTLKRLMAAEGETTLIETWGYDHESALASDTRVVCDWSGVEDMQLPTCTKGTCPGHHADDLLPMGDFLGEGETYTNWEFYEFTSPSNDDLPYVYDSFTVWNGCAALNYSFTDIVYGNGSGGDDGMFNRRRR
jgi:hypothetical protein